MKTYLRMTGRQHAQLQRHLFPGDGYEAAAVLLCGRATRAAAQALVVREVMEIPYAQCPVREPDRLTWRTDVLRPLIAKAAKEHLAVVKVHSHPGGFARFSRTDDLADREFLASVHGWTDDGLPHGSMIMLPGGRCFGRVAMCDGVFKPVDLVTVVGDDLKLWWHDEVSETSPEFTRRHAQAFGAGTTNTLRRLRMAVIGVSGTGSLVTEFLARLGVGGLVLVDPERIEEKNLNRIVNSGIDDARVGRLKVDVAAEAIARMGLGTEVTAHHENLANAEVIRAVSDCDLVVGCMDGAQGRHLLNRLAVFYLLPYLDVGVRLDADGHGGINQICGSVHYLQPDGSSLLSRGVVTLEEVRAEGLLRSNPEEYKRQALEGYIKGVRVDRPAVVTVNALYASLAVNELLARIHGYRDDGNGDFARNTCSLTQNRFESAPDGEPCPVLARHVGRGDVTPLLNMPELSELAVT
jgi:hypothetical protein